MVDTVYSICMNSVELKVGGKKSCVSSHSPKKVSCAFLSLVRSRHQSVVKGVNALPPEDRLLKFLVDNSADSEETVQCANCDWECKKQVF